MDWSLKVITQLPLGKLWTAEGPTNAKRARSVGPREVAALLRDGPVRFVVADIGDRPAWVPETDCFSFWKSEVKSRIVEADASSWRPEAYPGEYCFVASEWAGAPGRPIVVLERQH